MGNAATDNPATWCSFDEALASFCAGKVDGIGFVFTAGDPYTGIDFDHVRDTVNGVIVSWALNYIVRLDSYTEISPTGKGLHVIVKGKLPPKGRRQGQLEMYDDRRFFTMTGVLLGALK